MRKAITPTLSLTVVLLAGVFWRYHCASGSERPGGGRTKAQTSSSSAAPKQGVYRPGVEHDPPVPQPPSAAVKDFQQFLERLGQASKRSLNSLVLDEEALDQARQVFFNTSGVPKRLRVEQHSPFFAVNPEAVFGLYADLPTLERGMALFQQSCSQCHGVYGRGNGAATLQWYSGNYPRNFWYGKFKSRSTEYGTSPTDGDLFRTLTRGLYGSSMPSFRHLSVADRWSLVQFIKSLANFYDDYDEIVVNRFDPKGDFAPAPLKLVAEPAVNLESVTRGRILFIKQGCVTCHQGKQPKPVGLSRSAGSFSNWNDEMNRPIHHSRDLTTRVFLAGAASSDLFRIIAGGPNVGPMPNYKNLSNQDRWALVHYLQSIFKADFPQAPASADARAKTPEKSRDSTRKK